MNSKVAFPNLGLSAAADRPKKDLAARSERLRRPDDVRRGLTLIEVMVVAAFVAVIAAITYPAFMRAKGEAKIVASLGRLKQSALAVQLYMSDEALSSTPQRLPSGAEVVTRVGQNRFYGLTRAVVQSACGRHPKSETPFFLIFLPSYPVGAPSSVWTEWTNWRSMEGEQAVIFADENCNPAGLDLYAPQTKKLALGVRVDTSLVRKRGSGSLATVAFWNPNR